MKAGRRKKNKINEYQLIAKLSSDICQVGLDPDLDRCVTSNVIKEQK